MTTIYAQIHDDLTKALQAARMEKAGFGFPNDRIVIQSSHFENQGFVIGAKVHPTEFIVKATEHYRRAWIEHPILRALHILETHGELLERVEELAQALDNVNLDRIRQLAKRT